MESQKNTIVVFSGDMDKVMAALIISSTSAAMGDEVVLFFTFWGINALRREKPPKLHKKLLHKMFGWMMPRGIKKLALSKLQMMGLGKAFMNRAMGMAGVATPAELLAQAQAAGVKLYACEMSLQVMGIQPEELIDGVELAGAATYLFEASAGRVNLFI
jgi:peroxiredoxin family protein